MDNWSCPGQGGGVGRGENAPDEETSVCFSTWMSKPSASGSRRHTWECVFRYMHEMHGGGGGGATKLDRLARIT